MLTTTESTLLAATEATTLSTVATSLATTESTIALNWLFGDDGGDGLFSKTTSEDDRVDVNIISGLFLLILLLLSSVRLLTSSASSASVSFRESLEILTSLGTQLLLDESIFFGGQNIGDGVRVASGESIDLGLVAADAGVARVKSLTNIALLSALLGENAAADLSIELSASTAELRLSCAHLGTVGGAFEIVILGRLLPAALLRLSTTLSTAATGATTEVLHTLMATTEASLVLSFREGDD